MSYQLNAKYVFLTYSQTPETWTKESLLEKLPSGYVKHCISKESHQDGGIHFHVLLCHSTSFRTRNSRYFDVDGVHPNVQAARDHKATRTYVKKDGDFIESDNWSDDVGSKYSSALTCQTRDEFFSYFEKELPRDYILNYERLEYVANKRFKSIIPPYQNSYINFILPDELIEWTTGNLSRPRPERPKSLWIVGESRLGKTVWARSLGRHMYFNGMFNLDDWDNDADYLILDDFDWKFIPSKKGLIGAQNTIVLSDKYRKKQTLIWGKPVIILSNHDGDVYNTCDERTWLLSNCTYFILHNKLF
nr:MAG: replication associated protein [Cressdnaviricota sp.]